MDPWKVTRGDSQFPVADLPALIALVKKGELDAGDMIQPPGTDDWVYASEVPALQEHLPSADDDDDLDYKPGRSMMPLVLLGGLGVVIATGLLGLLLLIPMLPSGNESLIGDGGLSYSQVIVTNAGVSLLDEPTERSKTGAPVAKDAALDLLAKRKGYYKVRTSAGGEGWIPVNKVVAMYKLSGKADVVEKYDPLYNPDQYCHVQSASWLQLPQDPRKPVPEDGIPTVFNFMLKNISQYDMTGIVVLNTIKNAQKSVIGELEIPIGGVVPKQGSTMVGMLKPEKEGEGEPVFMTEHSFNAMLENDPELAERWSVGIEMKITLEDFDNASVDLLELAAVTE